MTGCSRDAGALRCGSVLAGGLPCVLPPLLPPLQDATASTRPSMLLTRMNAGHGIGAPFSQRVGDTAIGLTFFAHELGPGIAP